MPDLQDFPPRWEKLLGKTDSKTEEEGFTPDSLSAFLKICF